MSCCRLSLPTAATRSTPTALRCLFLDHDRNEFYFPYVSGSDSGATTLLAGVRFPADQGFAGVALKSGRSVKVDDVQGDSRFFHGADQKTGLTTRNLVATPLMSHQGPLGVIEIINRRGTSTFSDEDVHFLEALAGSSIAIAIENARLYAQIREVRGHAPHPGRGLAPRPGPA